MDRETGGLTPNASIGRLPFTSAAGPFPTGWSKCGGTQTSPPKKGSRPTHRITVGGPIIFFYRAPQRTPSSVPSVTGSAVDRSCWVLGDPRGASNEATYLNYCRSLRFEDRPDYAYL